MIHSVSARASKEGSEKGKAPEGSSSSCGDYDAGAELALGDPSLKPLRIMPSRAEPAAGAERLTAAILLSPGAGAGEFSIRAADDGEHLELRAAWAKPFVDARALHRARLPKEGEGAHAKEGSN